MKKKFLIIILILTTFITNLCSCNFSSANLSISDTGFYFNTIINITLYDITDTTLIDKCFEIADNYEKMFSNTIPNSDISQINSNAGISAVKVHPETIELINKGIYYSNLSDGKFDITIGNLSKLWNISEICQQIDNDDNQINASVIPDQAEITNQLKHINYKNIIVDADTVFLSDSDANIDLGGIAKGYIADKMKEFLLKQNVKSGIINLGGNVLTIGEKNNETPFNVGIQKPFDNTGNILASIPVNSKSVVTSGIYERFYKVDNIIYHHLLDTTTGYPITNNLLSVTIVNDSSCDGDALSTTCFALGLDEGMKLIEDLENTEAIFVTTDNKIHCSSNLKEVITEINNQIKS